MNEIKDILGICHKIIMHYSFTALGRIKGIEIKKYNQQQFRKFVDQIVIEEIGLLLTEIEEEDEIR